MKYILGDKKATEADVIIRAYRIFEKDFPVPGYKKDIIENDVRKAVKYLKEQGHFIKEIEE